MARISTSFFNQRAVTNIIEQQSLLSRLQEQIATGNRIVRPSDDPSGSTQILRLTQAIELNNQYQRNLNMGI
ncbi:MAG: flagellar hook-associated protein 3, partial [Thiotrichales bacterium]|nr:flagellar hook-associated protein 3 [Thiotrichales bacterium]